MKFSKLVISGAFLIKPEVHEDERGSLMRVWCKQEFAEHGIDMSLLQGYFSTTKKKGTIRGMHAQVAPAAEDKLTQVIKGEIYEVLIDLRTDSTTYMKWEGITVKSTDNLMMFVPAGVAHGFLTLTDDVEFSNMSSRPFTPESEKGVRFDDPSFKINWPIPVVHVSDKDKSWQDYKRES